MDASRDLEVYKTQKLWTEMSGEPTTKQLLVDFLSSLNGDFLKAEDPFQEDLVLLGLSKNDGCHAGPGAPLKTILGATGIPKLQKQTRH